jgi:hypothetical protein
MRISEVVIKPVGPMTPAQSRIYSLRQGIERSKEQVARNKQALKAERDRQRLQREQQRRQRENLAKIKAARKRNSSGY